MLQSLLAVSSEIASLGFPKEIPVGEAAIYALIGFAVVFAGISFLIFVVWLVGKLMSSNLFKAKSSNKATKKAQKETKKPDSSASSTHATERAETEVSDEIVAVITASLMAYYSQNNPKCSFTVKRIKRM